MPRSVRQQSLTATSRATRARARRQISKQYGMPRMHYATLRRSCASSATARPIGRRHAPDRRHVTLLLCCARRRRERVSLRSVALTMSCAATAVSQDAWATCRAVCRQGGARVCTCCAHSLMTAHDRSAPVRSGPLRTAGPEVPNITVAHASLPSHCFTMRANHTT